MIGRLLLIWAIIVFGFNPVAQASQNVFLQRVSATTSMGNEWAAWITNEILYYCNAYQVDPFLAFALFEQESGFNMQSRSAVGAIGITQLMPETAKSLGVDPYDAQQNIEAGVRYLAMQLHQFEWAGKMQNTYAIAAYNAGASAVYQYGTVPPYAETYQHVTAIAENYKSLADAYYAQAKEKEDE